MFTIADAHCDTLYRIAKRGFTHDMLKVTPENMAAGHVGLQTFALFSGAGDDRTPYLTTLKMLDAVDHLGVPVLTGDLPETLPQTPTGVLSSEGGEMFEGSMERFRELMTRARFRMVALTWNYENEIGHPAAEGPEGGLKPFGKQLLKEMDKNGVLPDVSHLNIAGFWDVCEYAALPPIASHSDARWVCDVPRNLWQDQAKAIIERKGYIGINFCLSFIKPEGAANIDDVRRHIDAFLDLGAEDVLGFGSDFDGINAWPDGVDDPSCFPKILDDLSAHGYSDALLAKFAGGNLWRVLKYAEAQRRV